MRSHSLSVILISGAPNLAVRICQIFNPVSDSLKAPSGIRTGGSDGCTHSSGTFPCAEKCEYEEDYWPPGYQDNVADWHSALFAYLYGQPIANEIDPTTCSIMSSIESVFTTLVVIGVEVVILIRGQYITSTPSHCVPVAYLPGERDRVY